MPQVEYIIQTEHTSSSTAKHYHGVSITTLNTFSMNNVPDNAIVNSILVYYKGKTSLGDTKLYVGFTNDSSSEPGHKLISTEIKTSAGDGWYAEIPRYGRHIDTSYSVLSVYMNSGILYKKFTCYSFKVIYDYYIPDYTLTVNAGTGGTVAGGGIYANKSTVTLTARANKGYRFVKWSDGNTEKTRLVTVTSDATYTAEFELIPFEVVVKSLEGVHGAIATVSGGGQYKFGDTITIKADIPPYHEFYGWDCFSTGGGFSSKENPLVVTLNESFMDEGDTSCEVHFICHLEFTGYTLKANVTPDKSGAVYWGYMMNLSSGQEYYRGAEVPNFGMLIFEDSDPSLDYLLLEAIPNKGYEFVQWSDGVTANPREANLAGDATFTAIFRYVKIDNAYAGINQSSSIYAGIEEIKAVYVGTTKVYG